VNELIKWLFVCCCREYDEDRGGSRNRYEIYKFWELRWHRSWGVETCNSEVDVSMLSRPLWKGLKKRWVYKLCLSTHLLHHTCAGITRVSHWTASIPFLVR